MWFRCAANGGREKGNVDFHGMTLYIEYPKGSTRSGTNSEGEKWSRKMKADYGRIPKTDGSDGDCVDVYLGDDLSSEKVFVVNQTKDDGSFDEHKCIVGCGSASEAKKLYAANYPKDFKIGKIVEMGVDKFKQWVKSGDMSKPTSE